nr:ubiquitin-conjugating enzyme/RWD-like protein [Tanacetum cinerariifolium]
ASSSVVEPLVNMGLDDVNMQDINEDLHSMRDYAEAPGANVLITGMQGLGAEIGSLCGEHSSLLFNENVFIKSLKTIVYTMKQPPKKYVDWYFKRLVQDIREACNIKETDSDTFRNDLASCTESFEAAYRNIALA